MKVKNLVISDTKVVKTLKKESNFKFLITTRPNGYRILEKRYVKLSYGIFKRKRYFVPGTDIPVDKYYGQNEGSIIRSGWARPLWLYERKKEIPQEKIVVLEKKLNKQR